MIQTAIDLAAGLFILGAQAGALFLMILGAIDLHTHYTEKRERATK